MEVTKNTAREWGGELAHVLPKIKTLGALVEAFPGLGRHAGQEPGPPQDGQGASQINIGEDRLGRTESEENEYEYQKSIEMMRQEKTENATLLETLKLVQGLDPGTLYEHEISLLRESISQKQDMINSLHSKGLELSQKTKYLHLELHDQQDRTSQERERLMKESKIIERSIKEIQEDRQCAVQKLHQYQLLYTRTKEDRDEAEAKMLRARELVELGKEDLHALKECLQNKIKVSQDTCEKKLNVALAELETSRVFWKSSLERKRMEIDAIIDRYENAKAERTKEEERQLRERHEAEQARNELYEEQKRNETALKNDLRRLGHVQREQWGLICAAAGLEADSSVSDVTQAYDTLLSLQDDLKNNTIITIDRSELTETSEIENVLPGGADISTSSSLRESTVMIDRNDKTKGVLRRDAIIARIEMSLLYIQEKLAEFFEESSPNTGEDLKEAALPTSSFAKLRRRSSMLALHPRRLSAAQLEKRIDQKRDEQKYSQNEPFIPTSPTSLSFLQPQINGEQLYNNLEKLAAKSSIKLPPLLDMSSIIDLDPADALQESSMDQLVGLLPHQHIVKETQVDTKARGGLMGVHEEPKVHKQDAAPVLITPDTGLKKQVLSREDIKSRSLKIKAKLDKQRQYAS